MKPSCLLPRTGGYKRNDFGAAARAIEEHWLGNLDEMHAAISRAAIND